MSEENLNRLAYEILPAIRMRLAGERMPALRIDRRFAAASHDRDAFDRWRKEWGGVEAVFVDWQRSDSDVVVAAMSSSMREAQGLLMLRDAGLLAWGSNITEAEALLHGEKESPQEEHSAGALSGRIALITGAAQGFGKGLAEYMAADGACVMVADINEETGQRTVQELTDKTGNPGIAFIRTDVTDSASVENMVQETVLAFGGLDLFISNAGVLKAGGLDQLEEKAFDFVTNVNYKGFYLGVKNVSKVMRTQHTHRADHFMDIIQINSKSGLQGSNRNFAYAGSKFGSIGLVQSFALELVTENIKVNAVCPGNFFDGPLWSDPENGLFVQYLRAGKVAGAKSIADVRRHYESLVPMGRGTTVEDVYKAVRYLIDQEYETGQALPVTGGQVMLK
jgi:sorbitol-6-phosphate 2-dehydrogenase